MIGAFVEAGFVVGDGDAGGIAKLAGLESEGPGVPGAGDAVVFDFAFPEGAAGVGTHVVEGEILAVMEEDGELEAVDFDVLALVGKQFVGLAEGDPLHLPGSLAGVRWLDKGEMGFYTPRCCLDVVRFCGGMESEDPHPDPLPAYRERG